MDQKNRVFLAEVFAWKKKDNKGVPSLESFVCLFLFHFHFIFKTRTCPYSEHSLKRKDRCYNPTNWFLDPLHSRVVSQNCL